MNVKKLALITKKFQKKMQKIVDSDRGITKISMQVEGEKPIIIAETPVKKPVT